MKNALTLLLLAAGLFGAEPPSTLVTKALAGIPGKEGSLLRVELAPGSVGSAHRHNANVFVYVLEGSIVMQVKGGKEVTLGPGETFTETPDDIHVVSRNASKTKPAVFLAFLIKDTGAPVVVPVP